MNLILIWNCFAVGNVVQIANNVVATCIDIFHLRIESTFWAALRNFSMTLGQ